MVNEGNPEDRSPKPHMVGIKMLSCFTAHSTKGTSYAAVAGSGVTTADILKAADWSLKSVSKKF